MCLDPWRLRELSRGIPVRSSVRPDLVVVLLPFRKVWGQVGFLLRCIRLSSFAMYNLGLHAGIAQLVERNLAKVEVASSSLVSRSIFKEQPVLVVKQSPHFCLMKFLAR